MITKEQIDAIGYHIQPVKSPMLDSQLDTFKDMLLELNKQRSEVIVGLCTAYSKAMNESDQAYLLSKIRACLGDSSE